jgi:nucleotide-binding universal stress UspA family protein
MQKGLPRLQMKLFNHILVPTDFGSSSARAIETAVTLAQTFDSELTLLHVWEIPVYPYMEFVLESAELVDTIEQAAAKDLATSLAEIQKSVPRATSILKMGPPGQQIADTIAAVHPDLVVMGTHGRHGLGRVLLGSVAEKTVRLSPVPVLTIRGEKA